VLPEIVTAKENTPSHHVRCAPITLADEVGALHVGVMLRDAFRATTDLTRSTRKNERQIKRRSQ
jgi:hypothetical protein